MGNQPGKMAKSKRPGPKNRTPRTKSSPECVSSPKESPPNKKKRVTSTERDTPVSSMKKPGPKSKTAKKPQVKQNSKTNGKITNGNSKTKRKGQKRKGESSDEEEAPEEIISDDEEAPEPSVSPAKKRKNVSPPVSKSEATLTPKSNKKSGTKTSLDDSVSSIQSVSPTIEPFGFKIKAFSKSKLNDGDGDSKKQKAKPRRKKSEKPEVKAQPERIRVKEGPRATGYNDNDKWFAVENILDKWVGKATSHKIEPFYLVQWTGHDQPSKNDESAWLHLIQFKGCEDMIAAVDAKFELKKELKQKSTKKFWDYVSEDEQDVEAEKEKKRKALYEPVAGVEVAGKQLRVRKPNDQSENGSVNGSISGSPIKPKKKATTKSNGIPYSNDAQTGFDKGWTPVKIHFATIENGHIVYFVEFEEDPGKTEGILGNDFKKKAPELLIDYLVPKLKGVPKINVPIPEDEEGQKEEGEAQDSE